MSDAHDPPWPEILAALQGEGEQAAYACLCRSWPFPGMAARLSAHLLHPENAAGPSLRDIVCRLSARAQEAKWTPCTLPGAASGKHVGIVGAGPAGLAATVALLQRGHAVTLYEQSDQLGGMPQLVIRAQRCPDVEPEIYAVLQPALDAGCLQLRFGHELGRNIGLDILRASHAAVLLATGLWEEASIGERVPGLVDALTFLQELKRGTRNRVPDRVVILGGGDCAMDVSAAVHALGAKRITFMYHGSREGMHWHLPADWFETHGVALMDRTRVAGVARGTGGVLTGLLLERESGETVLEADLVIEAMGLEVATGIRDMVETGWDHGPVFAAGALSNGGASVSRCMAEGLQVAVEIDRFLG